MGVTAPSGSGTETAVARLRPANARLAAFGFTLIGATMAMFLVASLVSGITDVGFLVVVGVVSLATAYLVLRFGTWSKILGIVVAIAAALMLFWTVFGLAHAMSPLDFVAGFTVPLGIIFGLAGSIGAIVSKRRGRLVTTPTRLERRIITGVLGLVVVAALASSGLYFANRTTVAEADRAGATPVVLHDFAFQPATIEVAAGQPTRLYVRNADPVQHDFTVPELGIKEVLLPGSAKIITINAAAGTYNLYCVLHSDPNETDPEQNWMAGRVVAR